MGSGKFARSWELTKQAWSVLRQDKRLLIFPLISGTLVTLLVTATVIGLIAAVLADKAAGGAKAGAESQDFLQTLGPWKYVGLFLLYLITHFIVTFFQSALFACALKRLNGEKPTVSGGIRVAISRLPQIFGWSLVNATVGILLQMAQERVGWIARIFLGMASIGWNIATFFVVPVLVIEGVGPVEAVKRSAGVIKKTWGESLITQAGFSAVATMVGFLLFLLLAGGGIALAVALEAGWPAAAGISLAILTVIVLAVLQSAMKTLLIAATYRFATTGAAAGPFEARTLQAVFQPKTK